MMAVAASKANRGPDHQKGAHASRAPNVSSLKKFLSFDLPRTPNYLKVQLERATSGSIAS
jgi:hypothetical protein